MISKVAFAAVIALASQSLSSPAFAQSETAKKEAQALQGDGLRLMQKGDNRGALNKFDEAFRLVASPKILFNRGKAHRALGENVEALTDFERFLDEAPYAPKESRAEATRAVEALRPTLSYLEIETDDVGSKITIDGQEVGTAPLARATVVAPGAHEIRVAKSGMNEDVRSVSPIAGQKLRVVVKLLATATSAPPPLPAGPVAPAGPPAPTTTPPAPPLPAKDAAEKTPPASAARPWQITAAWVAGGAGVLFLAGGITAQVLSASKASEFNDVPNMMCNRNLPNDGGGPCKGLADAADQRKTLAIVGYVASGLALAGSLALYLTAPSPAAGAHDTAAACFPSETSGSGFACALTMRF